MTATTVHTDTPIKAVDIGRTPRLVSSLVSALILSQWVGWVIAALWFLSIFLWEIVLSPPIRQAVDRGVERDARVGRYGQAGVIAVGALLYVWGWSYAWATGGDGAAFIAALWFAGSLLHGLFYFSDRPLELAACVGPAFVVGMIMPWVTEEPTLAASMVIVGGFLVATVLRGVKDRNRLLRQAVKAAAARASAERANEQKSQFLASMSHELRTPLTAVIGYAELIADEAESDGRLDTASDAQRIRAAAKHLLGLVNEILDLAKIEAGRMEVIRAPTDLAALLEDAGAILAPLAAANGNTLSIDVDRARETIVTDAGKLKQCIVNLGGNACKFTRNGRIAIVAAIEAGAGGRVLRVTVSDTGPGIAPEQAARLFQPFVQAETSLTGRPNGTGLGLAITRSLAELLGGTVTLESAVGKGATFTLTIAAPAAELRALPKAA